jgi:hypothetical protein
MKKGGEMKRQNFLMICLMLFLFSGCKYPMVLRQPDLSHDVKAQESEVSKDGISFMAKCIYLKSEMKTYFDRDLVHYGILPVQIYIQNKSYPKTVVLNIDGINLIDLTGAKNSMLSCDQIIEKRKEILRLLVGTSISLFDPIGFMIGSIESSDKITKIKSSYESHSIKFGNIISGGVTEGFTFFSVPKDLNNLNGWKISVVLKDTETKNDIILEYALSGSIVPPNKRSEWVEDYVETK